MDFDYADLAMAVYNIAVVMSGGYLTFTFGAESPLEMLPIAVVVGLLWTLYYHVSMADRLEDIRTGSLGPEAEPEEPGPDGEETPEEADEGDHKGVEPPWN